LNQLKKLREAYTFHVANHILLERARVNITDARIAEEKAKGKLSVANVFEVAGVEQEEEAEEKSDSDAAQEEEEIKVPSEYDMVGRVTDYNVKEKDQGFTRPKVLILVPFKMVAYSVVEQLVYHVNNNKWKKVDKKKKFKEEFGKEEEAFDDYFRIGLAIDKRGRIKLFEQFYHSDIIVGKFGLHHHLSNSISLGIENNYWPRRRQRSQAQL